MRLLKNLLIGGGLTAALLVSGARAAAPASAEAWLEHYYEQPAPGQFATAITELSQHGYFEKPGHVARAIGFIGTVFAENPRRVAEWMAVSRDLPAAHQRLLVAALWYSGLPQGRDLLRDSARYCEPDVRRDVEALLARPAAQRDARVASSSSLNLQWGVFLASGDAAPVRQILAALGDDASSPLSQDIRWSLAQNAAAHERVLAICREELSRQPNGIRETLRAVINETENHHAPTT